VACVFGEAMVVVVMVVVDVVMIVHCVSRMRFRVRISPALEDCGELGGQQPGADQRDQGIAHNLELVRPGRAPMRRLHLLSAGTEGRRRRSGRGLGRATRRD
jgi:hypothetical protein